MRLIECDRCGTTVEYRKPDSIYPGYPDGWIKSDSGFGNDLCPACVERALEKPERSPVLTATDMPDVPIVRGDHDTLNQLLQGKPAVCGHLGVKAGDVCACGVTVEDAEVFKAKV